ncbi:MAG: NrfD/PsrC family molybdoenzyme membrane anchor subunit [Chloroflexota bacterium]
MLSERLTEVHWTWLIYTEMFLEGVAVGLIIAAFFLALAGRGHAPTARTAHLLAFPVMLIVTLMLIVDLNRPERFWHMVIMNEQLRLMLKPWSPISLGTWLIIAFTGLTFISFLDALIAGGRVRLGAWQKDRTVHGGPLGLIVTCLGAVTGLAVAIYAGVLLSVTNIPGWAHAPSIAAVYAASAPVLGIALLVLVQSIRGWIDADVLGLAQTNIWLIAFWLAVTLVFLLTLGLSSEGGARYFLYGWPLLAILGAIILGGIIPLIMRIGAPLGRPRSLPISAALVLLGGFLLRIGIVMGPQEWMH